MQVQLLTSTAIAPTLANGHCIGFDLHLDKNSVTVVLPNSTCLLSTSIATKAASDTYLHIAQRSGLTIKVDLHTLAGVVDPAIH